MSFCSNCGQKITAQIKFCPACGTKVLGLTSGVTSREYLKGYKEKMYKNTVITLKNEGKKFVKQKAKEAFSTFTKNKFKASKSTQPIAETFKPKKTFDYEEKQSDAAISKIDIWTWIYIVINAILLYLGNALDEVIGIMLFSVIIILTVLLRRKKPKPYNWLVKIILVLQAVFLIALLADRIEFLGTITLLMAALLLVNFRLLFKGNKI